MDKEKLITIGIGLAVGITLALAYFAGRKLLPKLSSLQNVALMTPTPTSAPSSPKLTISLDSPADHTSTTSGTVTVAGKTLPNTKVVIFANADQKIATSSATGTFSADISLEEGENSISVTAIDAQGNLQTEKRDITMEVSQ